MKRSVIKRLADLWPTHNALEAVLVTGGTTALMLPNYGLVPRTFGELLTLNNLDPHLAQYVSGGLLGLAAPVMLSRLVSDRGDIGRMFFSRKKRRGLQLGPMWVPETTLWTHIKVTGMTGSGKTSAVFIPALKQLLELYNDEDDDRRAQNPHKKIGMAVLEVKGTFFEYIVYLVHEVGRHAAEDVVLFRPDPRLPLARFVDEKNRHWYLNALAHTWRDKETSSDAHQPYADMRRPGSREVYPPTVFEDDKRNLPLLAEMRDVTLQVTPDMRFVGWRRDGDELVRISHTPNRDQPEHVTRNGREVRVPPPKTLKFVEVIYVRNGLRTNLVKPELPITENAARLTILAKMRKGTAGGDHGQNEFFYDKAKMQIQSAIAIHRAVHHADNKECTAIDIVRLSTDEKHLDHYINELQTRCQVIKTEIGKVADASTRQLRMDREYQPMIDLISYFNNEWKNFFKGEGKVGASINGVITNCFQEFTADPNLRETYCSPQTIDYRSIFNEGKIICFVPGKKYETLQRVLATDFKMDVISTGLARKALGLEMWRPTVFVQDEGHEYIISHDVVGDNKALAQLREFRMFFLMGTQSDAWVKVAIGRAPSDVYCQGYGTCVFLRNNDEDSNKNASYLCGRTKVEDRNVQQSMSLGGMIMGDQLSAKQTLGYKERSMIEPHEFSMMKTGEGVVWRTGEDGHSEQVRRGRFEYDFATSEAGHAAVGDRMRHYFREVMENALHKTGEVGRLDCDERSPAPPITPAGGEPETNKGPVTQPQPKAEDTGGEREAKTKGDGDKKETDVPSLSPDIPIPNTNRRVDIGLPGDPKAADLPPPTEAEKPTVPQFPKVEPQPPLTPERIAQDVEEFERFLCRVDATLDRLDFVPVGNHDEFMAELKQRYVGTEAEKLRAANLPTGPNGQILGRQDVAANAAPKIDVPPSEIDPSKYAKGRAEKERRNAAWERAGKIMDQQDEAAQRPQDGIGSLEEETEFAKGQFGW